MTLFFGLRPKDYDFSNNARWIHDQAGIRFSKYGIAYTDPIKGLRNEKGFGEKSFSIEIALKPLNKEEGFNFIFVIHNGDDRNQLLLGQWRSWIIAMNEDDYDYKRRVKRISVDSASRSHVIQFITLTTGKDGTKVYFDGQVIRSNKDLTLRIPHGDNVRLIFGNSLYGKHSWRGDLYGFAFYRHTLSAQDAAIHFNRWSQEGNFSFAKNDEPVLLYYFDEKQGASVSNHAGDNHHLKIPSRMPILKKAILSAPLKGFKFDNRGAEDIVLNLAGFIPLGFIFAATFVRAGSKHSILITVALCFTLSLFIEIIQAWLPSRSSSQMDLICNTTGSVIGIFMAHWVLKKE